MNFGQKRPLHKHLKCHLSTDFNLESSVGQVIPRLYAWKLTQMLKNLATIHELTEKTSIEQTVYLGFHRVRDIFYFGSLTWFELGFSENNNFTRKVAQALHLVRLGSDFLISPKMLIIRKIIFNLQILSVSNRLVNLFIHPGTPKLSQKLSWSNQIAFSKLMDCWIWLENSYYRRLDYILSLILQKNASVVR